ncbi:MAG: efflux RND transporter periplasmic adaptor subunit [Fusobacteria bacterium]|nr:efflux RND transporter periplasmic adaptor subunit [Fusobacteriota bacterium]
MKKILKNKGITATLIVIIIVVIAVMSMIIVKNNKGLQEYKIRVVTPMIKNIGNSISLQGETVSKSIITIYGTSGFTLQRVNVTKGDIVKQGEVLGEYTPENIRTLQTQILAGQVDLQKIEAQIDQLGKILPTTNVDNEKLKLVQVQNDLEIMKQGLPLLKRDNEIQQSQLQVSEQTFASTKNLYDKALITKFDFNRAQVELNSAEMAANSSHQKYSSEQIKIAVAIHSINQQNNIVLNAQKEYDKEVEDNNYEKLQLGYDLKKQQMNLTNMQTTYSQVLNGIISPVDGIIENAAASGTVLDTSRDSKIFEIVDTGKMELEVLVPSKYIRNVNIGDLAQVEASDLSCVFNAKVSKIGGVVSRVDGKNLSGNFINVILTVENQENLLKPNYKVKVTIDLDSKDNAFVVPKSTIVTSGSEKFVYTLTSDNTVEKTPVTVGVSNDTETEITSGLAPDSRVIASLKSLIKPGAKLKGEQIIEN